MLNRVDRRQSHMCIRHRLETIDEMDYLSAPDSRRIALVALESGRVSRAKDLLLQSHASVHGDDVTPVPYIHLRAHDTGSNLVCRLLLEK